MFKPDTDIPDLSGKFILVTGGNTGLGRETCFSFAKHNPKRIFIAARHAKSAESVINDMKQLAPLIVFTFVDCDLGSLASVNKAAKELISSTDRLDLLFCNARCSSRPDFRRIRSKFRSESSRTRSAHQAPSCSPPQHSNLLTRCPGYHHILRRLSFPSTRRHRLPRLTYHATQPVDPQFSRRQGLMASIFPIQTGKFELRCGASSSIPAIKFVVVHPGVCDTPMAPDWIKGTALSRKLFAPGGLKTPKEGSLSQLWAATAKDVVSGEYYEPVGIVGFRTPKSKDDELRGELWEWTEMQMKAWVSEEGGIEKV